MSASAATHAVSLHQEDTSDGSVLGVTRSLRGLSWRPRLDPREAPLAQALAQRHAVPEILGNILLARGARPETASEWLDPSLRRLSPDPASLRDMDVAAARFVRAIVQSEKIAVFGDYDVDGAASVALVQRFLKLHGQDALCRIPDRLTEGYGPNPQAMRELVEAGAALILTVDCGTTSHDALEAARAAGVDVVVLDHHQAGERLPPALAIVNPNRLDDLSGQGHLAAAGIVFLFLVEAVRRLRARGYYSSSAPEPDLLSLVDLVGLATVCDVAPLRGVNRAFVSKGLRAMRLRANAGIAALADAARLRGAPDARSLGFVLGPRINAGGRIGDCGLGARLLATGDSLEAQSISATLERLNTERRAIEAAMFEDALAQAEAMIELRDASFLLVSGEGWHQGVLGLIASRLVERLRRPALALAVSPHEATGSMRSIDGIDIGAAIRAAVEAGLAKKGGGHAMAGGVTLAPSGIAALGRFMEERISADVAQRAAAHALHIDAVLSPRAATPDLLELFQRVAPFGQGFPEPRLAFSRCQIDGAAIVGDGHVRFTARSGDGGRIDCIIFRAAMTPQGKALLEAQGAPHHLAGHLTADNWNGRARVKLVVEDVSPG